MLRLYRRVLVAILALYVVGCSQDKPASPLSSDLKPSSDFGTMVIPGSYDYDNDGLSDTDEETLVRQYRPYWYFDSQEFIFPISVTNYADIGGKLVFGFYESAPYYDLFSLQDAVHSYPTGDMDSSDYLIVGDRENYGPIYVDVVPMPSFYDIGGKYNLAWIHYWIFFGDDRKYDAHDNWHEADWEHICVMAERDYIGDVSRPPVKIHWHHHGGADISSTAYAYHIDSWGNYHPRVYVEAGAHGLFKYPGDDIYDPHNDGGGSPDKPLEKPIEFMTSHYSNRNYEYEMDIIQTFEGQWGNESEISSPPYGPLVFTDECDHDYNANPSSTSFKTSGCGVFHEWAEDIF